MSKQAVMTNTQPQAEHSSEYHNRDYHNSEQCCARLAGIEAIDYFLARQLVADLLPSTAASPERDPRALELFHLVLAVSAAPRAGHSTLPLAALAGELWWQMTLSTSPVIALRRWRSYKHCWRHCR